ncbi:MAG: HAMP domain-containing sensor histidine kinase, partial [Clostridia bacterium]|nr:HAMP domain-containing sensor histidine kinase [Clostridia bacterium]
MLMDLGFLYAVVAYVCFAITVVLLGQTYRVRQSETIDKSYATMLLFMLLFMFIDGTWGLHFSSTIKTNPISYEIFTYAFHFMAAWSAYVWYGYVISFAKIEGKLKKVFESFRHLLIVAQMTLLFTNLVNHQFFYFEDGIYHTMPLRKVGFILQYAYYVLLMIVSLVMFFVSKEDTRKRRFIVASSYSFIPLVFGIGQVVFPDAPMYSLGFVMTAVYIYVLNINKERDQYLESLYKQSNLRLSVLGQGLAYDYKVAYYVDLETNAFERIAKDNVYKEALDKIGDDGESADFFAVVRSNLSSIVYEDDIAYVFDMMDKDKIMSELKRSDSYTINYRSIIEGAPKYYRMKFAIPKVEGIENKLVIGVYDIDKEVKRELDQQKALEDALRLANSANAAKTSFLFNMSHDIRTPMNAIFGFAEIAKKNIDYKDKVLYSIDNISTAGTHLLELINEVLDMSRVESGKVVLNPEKESLLEAGAKIAAIIDLSASAKNITIDSKIVNLRDPYVMMDKLHFNQILINILSN